MSARTVSLAILCCHIVVSPANALRKSLSLGAAGYSQVANIKSTPEGISVKAMKNGKELSLVVDSSGQIQERH